MNKKIYDEEVNSKQIEGYLEEKYRGSTILVNGPFGAGKTTVVNKILEKYNKKTILKMRSYTPLSKKTYMEFLSDELYFKNIKLFLIWSLIFSIFIMLLSLFVHPDMDVVFPIVIKNSGKTLTLHLDFIIGVTRITATALFFIFGFKYISLLFCKVFNLDSHSVLDKFVKKKLQRYQFIVLDDFDRFISKQYYDECIALLQYVKDCVSEKNNAIVLVIGDLDKINELADDKNFFKKYYNYTVNFKSQYDIIRSILKDKNLEDAFFIFTEFGITDIRVVEDFVDASDKYIQNIYKCLSTNDSASLFDTRYSLPEPYINIKQLCLLFLKASAPEYLPKGLANNYDNWYQALHDTWNIEKINVGTANTFDIKITTDADLKAANLSNQQVPYINVYNVSFLYNLLQYRNLRNGEIVHHLELENNNNPTFLWDRNLTKYEISNNMEFDILRIIILILYFASTERNEYIKFWQFMFENNNYIGCGVENVDTYVDVIKVRIKELVSDRPYGFNDKIIEKINDKLNKLRHNIKKRLLDYSILTMNLELYESVFITLRDDLIPEDLLFNISCDYVGALSTSMTGNQKNNFLTKIKQKDLYY